MSLVQSCLSPDTYDVFGAHVGIGKRAVDPITLAHPRYIPRHKAKNMIQCIMQHSIVISYILLYQGISVLVTGCYIIRGCHATSLVTPCSA